MHYCKKMNQLVKAEELRISSLVHSQKLQKRGIPTNGFMTTLNLLKRNLGLKT